MSFNIIDTMKDHLSDQVMARISDVISSDAGQTANALSGAIPGLFSSFTNIDNNESGAEALFAAVDDQDDATLDTLGHFFEGDNASLVANSGSTRLESILGRNSLRNLVDAVSKLSGLGSGSSSSVLGMLTPLALGVIKRKLLAEDNFDINGMISLLTGQKQNIQAALPQGFMQPMGEPLVAETDKLVDVEPITVTDKVFDTYETAEDESASWFSSLMPWIMVFAGVIVLYFILSGTSREVQIIEEQTSMPETIDRSGNNASEILQPPVKETPATHEKDTPIKESNQPDSQPRMENSTPAPSRINLTNELRNNLSRITQGLSGITDIESAKTALPIINDANINIDAMTSQLDSIPAPAKNAMGKLISSALPQLQVLSDKANDIPGVGSVINPALNLLSENLKKFP